MSIFKTTKINNKTKLTIYKNFGGEVKFKRYLNGWVMQELVYSLNEKN